MLEKLSVIEDRYDELSKKIADPDVISDQAVFAKLCKEQSDISPIVEKYREFKALNETIQMCIRDRACENIPLPALK